MKSISRNNPFLIFSPLNSIGMDIFLVFFKQLLSFRWVVFWHNILHLAVSTITLQVYLVKLNNLYQLRSNENCRLSLGEHISLTELGRIWIWVLSEAVPTLISVKTELKTRLLNRFNVKLHQLRKPKTHLFNKSAKCLVCKSRAKRSNSVFSRFGQMTDYPKPISIIENSMVSKLDGAN